MIYFSEQELDDFLLEDIYRGDLTTRALGLNHVPAKISFRRKNAGVVAGIPVAKRLLEKLGLTPDIHAQDGQRVAEGALLISAEGEAETLHQAWKVVQLVLEWCCGVAQYTADMVELARQINPNAVIACTRKSIPNIRKLATLAVLAGGGHLHRQGISETLLVFSNHRNLLAEPEDYDAIVRRLRQEACENKVTLEADNLAQCEAMLAAQPDIIQLDKFSPSQVKVAQELAKSYPKVELSVAGGVNRENVQEYARLGVRLFITSAPYYAAPEDIKVRLEKATF